MHQNPFLRPDAAGYPAIFADGIVRQLAQSGLDRCSVRAIARWMQVDPSAVFQKYSRARVIEVVVAEFADRWIQWSGLPAWRSRHPSRLPETEEERHGVRVWLLLGELVRSERLAGRGQPEVRYADAQRRERVFLERNLKRFLERLPTPDEVLTTMALVAGLRLLLIEPDPPLSTEQASTLLDQHVSRLQAAG